MFIRRLLAVVCAALFLSGSGSRAVAQGSIPTSGLIPISEILYDNTTTGQTNFFSSPLEYGDEIILKQHPTNELWIVTGFLFEYFGDFTPRGDEKGILRIYLNDGPRPNYPPQTILYQSEEFSLSPGFQTRAFTGINFLLPDDFGFPRFTWTVHFTGLRGVAGDQAGLLLRPTPTVGHSFKDLWMRGPSGWVLQQILPANPNQPVDPVTNPDPIENFGARVLGISSGATQMRLNIARQEGKLVLSWTATARLQSSESIHGPFRDVTGASSPYTVDSPGGASLFWRLAAGGVTTTPATLTIVRTDTGAVIQWNGGGRLQGATSVNGPYSDVAGATSPYPVPASDSSTRFWRVLN